MTRATVCAGVVAVWVCSASASAAANRVTISSSANLRGRSLYSPSPRRRKMLHLNASAARKRDVGWWKIPPAHIGSSLLDGRYSDRLRTLRALFDSELDPLVVLERFEPAPLDLRVVNEHIL